MSCGEWSEKDNASPNFESGKGLSVLGHHFAPFLHSLPHLSLSLTIYISVIQYIRWILPKEIAVRITTYSCTFFKEINTYRSFHVSEDCQRDFLYLSLSSELFLYQRVSVFSLHELSFRFRHVLAKLWVMFWLVNTSSRNNKTNHDMLGK